MLLWNKQRLLIEVLHFGEHRFDYLTDAVLINHSCFTTTGFGHQQSVLVTWECYKWNDQKWKGGFSRVIQISVSNNAVIQEKQCFYKQHLGLPVTNTYTWRPDLHRGSPLLQCNSASVQQCNSVAAMQRRRQFQFQTTSISFEANNNFQRDSFLAGLIFLASAGKFRQIKNSAVGMNNWTFWSFGMTSSFFLCKRKKIRFHQPLAKIDHCKLFNVQLHESFCKSSFL